MLSTAYVLILEHYWCQKHCIFLFLHSVQNPISKSFLFLRLDIPHYKILRLQCRISPKTLHTFKQNSFLFFYVFFPVLIFYLFRLKCYDWIYVKTKWCIEKDKTPEAVHLLKVSNKDTTGLLKVVQSENIWHCFCIPIDNFEQVSQITFRYLLPTLSIFCMQNVPFYLALFL